VAHVFLSGLRHGITTEVCTAACHALALNSTTTSTTAFHHTHLSSHSRNHLLNSTTTFHHTHLSSHSRSHLLWTGFKPHTQCQMPLAHSALSTTRSLVYAQRSLSSQSSPFFVQVTPTIRSLVYPQLFCLAIVAIQVTPTIISSEGTPNGEIRIRLSVEPKTPQRRGSSSDDDVLSSSADSSVLHEEVRDPASLTPTLRNPSCATNCVLTRARTRARTCTHTHTHTRARTHHACTHTHTHTHTHTGCG
jgi:hypothetical protein